MIADPEAFTGIETRRVHVDKGYRGYNHWAQQGRAPDGPQLPQGRDRDRINAVLADFGFCQTPRVLTNLLGWRGYYQDHSGLVLLR